MSDRFSRPLSRVHASFAVPSMPSCSSRMATAYATARITGRYRLLWRDGRSAGNGLPDERSSIGNRCTYTTCSPPKATNSPTLGKGRAAPAPALYLCVPLVRDGTSIGAIVLRRTEVHPFSDQQIPLLQTFA